MPVFWIAEDMTDPDSGEVIAEAGEFAEGTQAEKVRTLMNEYPNIWFLCGAGRKVQEVYMHRGQVQPEYPMSSMK